MCRKQYKLNTCFISSTGRKAFHEHAANEQREFPGSILPNNDQSTSNKASV